MKYLRRALDFVLPLAPFERERDRWMDLAALVTFALAALVTVGAFWLSLPQ